LFFDLTLCLDSISGKQRPLLGSLLKDGFVAGELVHGFVVRDGELCVEIEDFVFDLWH
jgi:hypothetical protein